MANKTYGTVSPERQKEMSGLEFVKGIASGALPLNTIAQTLGYDVVEAENGRVAITLDPTGAHLNPWGTVHGGLTATLLDSCMGLAIQSTLEKGVGSTTLEFKISLVRAITTETGRIRPRAKSSTAASVSVRQRAASPMPRTDCSRTVRRLASSSRTDAIAAHSFRDVRFGSEADIRRA
jgi:uncharacterized protein (TIGR00369 family)